MCTNWNKPDTHTLRERSFLKSAESETSPNQSFQEVFDEDNDGEHTYIVLILAGSHSHPSNEGKHKESSSPLVSHLCKFILLSR